MIRRKIIIISRIFNPKCNCNLWAKNSFAVNQETVMKYYCNIVKVQSLKTKTRNDFDKVNILKN